MGERATRPGRDRSILTIRWAEFDRLTSLRGWTTDVERARQIGISYQMLDHMRNDRKRPGPKVIDRFLSTFGPDLYPVLFERVARDAA